MGSPSNLASPDFNFLKSARSYFYPEVHRRVESQAFDWSILAKHRFLPKNIWFRGFTARMRETGREITSNNAE
jgi:hypothetical protein